MTEQEKVVEALQTAVLMENDGINCYRQAAADSKNEAGRQLLKSLADDEDAHLHKLEAIYKEISASKSWPATSFEPEAESRLRSIFTNACQVNGVNVDAVAAELDILKTAIDKEKKSYDFYERQISKTTYDVEREFYEKIAAEERGHELLLIDYREYLSDPAGWFVKTEHSSFDGG